MYTRLVTRLFLKILFLGVLIANQSVYSFAQLQYNFERINTDNGLPTNAIKGLQFDEKTRFLWVATESGIVRYNGHGFQNFGDKDANAALNGRINFFVKAIDGSFFGKLVDGRVFRIKDNKAIIDTEFKVIAVQEDYLAYKFKMKKNEKKSNLIDIDLSAFFYDSVIYTIYDYVLYKYDHGLKPIEKLKNEKTPFMINGQLFFLDNKGIVFKADIKNNQLIKYNKIDLFEFLKIGEKNNSFQFKVFQNHPSEPVYITYANHLFEMGYENNQLKYNLITSQLPLLEAIRNIQIDKITKAIYIGTDNRGLIIAKPKYFKRILPNIQKTGESASTYAQLLLKNGNIQSNAGQLYGTNIGGFKNVFYKTSNTATFITKDSILLFTNSDGLVEYDLKKNSIISISNDIKVNRNNFIQLNDTIFSFNEYGISKKILNSKWRYVLKFKKTPANFIVYSLMSINKNEILVATTDGLYKYNRGANTLKLYFRDRTKANFRAIYNLNGYYLLGTYGGGVYMFRNDTIKKIPLDQNKYLSFTHCFIQDKQKRVWASTNKGLFMSPEQSLIDFWNKGPGNIKFSYFGKSDGIDQLELNGGCSPCAIELLDGNFSFPGIDGLIQFNPNNIINNSIQPNIYIDRLLVNEKIVDNQLSRIELPSNTKNLEIQLGISGMLSEENILLEYKFDNEPWIRTNVKNSNLKFGNLSSGNHTVFVRSRNTILDKWLNVEYPFYIQYPWTLNPYMYFVYLILIICLVLFYIRFKTIIYQRRQRQLEFEVNLKTEKLNNLNDYLLKRNQAKDHVIAIMNHDILTPLKYLHITAKNISESSNEQQIKTSIKQIADTTKELEFLTSNMLNWVKFDNIETLPNKQYFDLSILVSDLIDFVQPFNQNKNIEIINEIESESYITNWPDSLRVLLYNLLVNALKATKQGSVSIAYKIIQNGGYILEVKDTGIGMSQSMINYLLTGQHIEDVEHHLKSKTGNGVGFQIIRNIVKLMNATIEIDSTENQGTKINVIFL